MEPIPRKSTASAQARPYAKAAYEIAKDSFSVPEWEEKLDMLAQLVKHPDIEKLLRDPRMTPAILKSVMVRVFDKLEMNDTQREFANELIDQKKLSLAPWIFEAYVKEKKRDMGIEDVTVFSALPLTAEQQDNITTRLKDKFNIKAEPQFKTDPDLIAGLKIQIGDKVIDQSAKGYLARLKKHLKGP